MYENPGGDGPPLPTPMYGDSARGPLPDLPGAANIIWIRVEGQKEVASRDLF